MKKNKTTLYHLILDRSGSMNDCLHGTIESFNSQIATIKKVSQNYPDQKFLVSLTVFNNLVVHLQSASEVSEVKQLSTRNYIPNGGTALLDAIGNSILKIDEKFSASIENEEMSIVLVILTDGQENSSNYFNHNSIATLLKKKEASPNWTISFLSAGIDLSNFARRINVRSSNTRSFSKRNISVMTEEINSSIEDYARSKSLGQRKKDFFERKRNRKPS